MNKYKILGIFANHCSNIQKYNIILSNISIINKYLKNICIIDTLNEEYSTKLKNDIFITKEVSPLINNYFMIENDNFFDFGKWVYGLKNIDYKDYDYILFINDSIILTEDIEKYFIYINTELNNKINLFAYNDSTQFKYHYQSYLFIIHTRIIPNFISFFEKPFIARKIRFSKVISGENAEDK